MNKKFVFKKLKVFIFIKVYKKYKSIKITETLITDDPAKMIIGIKARIQL